MTMSEEIEWDELKQSDTVQIVGSSDSLRELIKRTGYNIEDDGLIVDEDTGDPAQTYGGDPAYIDHIEAYVNGNRSQFVTNMAEFSRYLAEKGD